MSGPGFFFPFELFVCSASALQIQSAVKNNFFFHAPFRLSILFKDLMSTKSFPSSASMNSQGIFFFHSRIVRRSLLVLLVIFVEPVFYDCSNNNTWLDRLNHSVVYRAEAESALTVHWIAFISFKSNNSNRTVFCFVTSLRRI